MKSKEIRSLSSEDLDAKIVETRAEIVDLRFQLATRKLANLADFRKARKKLARLLTIQTQNQRHDGTAKTEKKG